MFWTKNTNVFRFRDQVTSILQYSVLHFGPEIYGLFFQNQYSNLFCYLSLVRDSTGLGQCSVTEIGVFSSDHAFSKEDICSSVVHGYFSSIKLILHAVILQPFFFLFCCDKHGLQEQKYEILFCNFSPSTWHLFLMLHTGTSSVEWNEVQECRAQLVMATCRTPGFRPSQLLIATLLFCCCNFVFSAAAVAQDLRGDARGVSSLFCLSQRAARHNKIWLFVGWLWSSLTSSSLGILDRVTDEGILFFLHVWVWPNWQWADRKEWVYWHVSAILALSLTFVFTLWWSDWEIFHPALPSFDIQSSTGEQDMTNKTLHFPH